MRGGICLNKIMGTNAKVGIIYLTKEFLEAATYHDSKKSTTSTKFAKAYCQYTYLGSKIATHSKPPNNLNIFLKVTNLVR